METQKEQSRFKWLVAAASILIPIVLIGLLFLKNEKLTQVVFTSLPPPPRLKPYTPEKKLSALQIMDLHSVDTNRPDIGNLMARVAELETELNVLESNIYSTNLTLWTYQQYDGVIDKWYHSKPSQRQAWSKYEYPTDVAEGKRRQKVCNEIHRLLVPVLFEEQLRDPDFGPLIKSAWEPLLKFKTGFFEVDQLAGLPRVSIEPLNTWDNLLSAVHKRYPRYVAAIQERVQAERVPADVVSDIKDYAASQTLSGLTVEMFVPLNTPKELTEMRGKLDRAIGDLSWARETNSTAKKN